MTIIVYVLEPRWAIFQTFSIYQYIFTLTLAAFRLASTSNTIRRTLFTLFAYSYSGLRALCQAIIIENKFKMITTCYTMFRGCTLEAWLLTFKTLIKISIK